MTKTLSELERDVEISRARLADNLTILRSPNTYAEVSGALKLEARDVKRDLMKSVRSRAGGYLDELKARAAANPAAVLTLAAGVAWRIFQKPPIASALVGAGLFSLFRTPEENIRLQQSDYLAVAEQRLKEQAAEFGNSVRTQAASIGETLADKSSEVAKEAIGAASGLSRSAGEATAEAAATVSKKVSEFVHDSRDTLREPAASAIRKVQGVARSTGDAVTDHRDQMLLSAAGVAVVAALGIAIQKRMEGDRSGSDGMRR